MATDVLLSGRAAAQGSMLEGVSPLVIGALIVLTPIAVATLYFSFTAALLVPALLFGWTQMGGRCGTAHVNVMATVWLTQRKLWFLGVLVYTLFGLLSSVIVGAALGWFGSVIGLRPGSTVFWLLAVLAASLTVREMGLVRFKLIERNCQTDRNWAYRFGYVSAAAMWAFHIGLGFFTVITYGGFWFLVGLILTIASPGYGVLVMTAYWIGRSLPMWIVVPSVRTMWKTQSTFPLFRPSHALALAWSTIIVTLMALSM